MPAAPADWPEFVRAILAAECQNANSRSIPPPPHEPETPHGGVFVTLYGRGRLRGCMGTLDDRTPLADSVRSAARSAAFQDPRFAPVTLAELVELRICVSILSVPQPLGALEDLELGRHGILVRRGTARGLFLPQVATDHRLDREAFVSRCCVEKAGLPADAWRDPHTQVLVFETRVFDDAP